MVGKERRKVILRKLINLNYFLSSIKIIVRFRLIVVVVIMIILWLIVLICIRKIIPWLQGVRLRIRKLRKVIRKHFSGLLGQNLLLHPPTNLKDLSPLIILFLLHHKLNPRKNKGKKKESQCPNYQTLRNRKTCKSRIREERSYLTNLNRSPWKSTKRSLSWESTTIWHLRWWAKREESPLGQVE